MLPSYFRFVGGWQLGDTAPISEVQAIFNEASNVIRHTLAPSIDNIGRAIWRFFNDFAELFDDFEAERTRAEVPDQDKPGHGRKVRRCPRHGQETDSGTCKICARSARTRR